MENDLLELLTIVHLGPSGTFMNKRVLVTMSHTSQKFCMSSTLLSSVPVVISSFLFANVSKIIISVVSILHFLNTVLLKHTFCANSLFKTLQSPNHYKMLFYARRDSRDPDILKFFLTFWSHPWYAQETVWMLKQTKSLPYHFLYARNLWCKYIIFILIPLPLQTGKFLNYASLWNIT